MAAQVAAPPSERKNSFVRWIKNERNWMPYLFVAPFFLTFIVFSLYPLLTSLIMPFQKAVGFEGKFEWVGMENFKEMFVGEFTREGYFYAFKNFILFGIGSLVTQMPSAFIIALLLSSPRLRLKGLWRSLLFVPGMLPGVTIGIIGGWFFSPTRGLINAVLELLGRDPINYQYMPELIIPGMLLMSFWQWTGYHAVFMLAAITNIDPSLTEAAVVDGATYWQQARYIIVPMIKPVLTFIILSSVLGSLGLYELPLFMFPANPGGQANTFMGLIISNIQSFNLGLATAMGWVVYVLGIGVMFIQVRALGLRRQTEGD
jgi:ABC-type sugar transport system permease subunit